MADSQQYHTPPHPTDLTVDPDILVKPSDFPEGQYRLVTELGNSKHTDSPPVATDYDAGQFFGQLIEKTKPDKAYLFDPNNELLCSFGLSQPPPHLLELPDPAPVESFWMENRIHQLMGVETELKKQLADAKALNKHYEKVLDRLVHNSIDAFPTPASQAGLQEVLTDTQCDYLSRESNPVMWLVRGKVESQNHLTYEPYDLEKDAHIEFYTEEPEQYDGPPHENDE
jgi:hypothetical protein